MQSNWKLTPPENASKQETIVAPITEKKSWLLFKRKSWLGLKTLSLSDQRICIPRSEMSHLKGSVLEWFKLDMRTTWKSKRDQQNESACKISCLCKKRCREASKVLKAERSSMWYLPNSESIKACYRDEVNKNLLLTFLSLLLLFLRVRIFK
jgi:hypothetical protein